MFSKRKVTAIILASIMAASSILGGCSAKEDNGVKTNITVTSSAAEAAAQTLAAKLPELDKSPWRP